MPRLRSIRKSRPRCSSIGPKPSAPAGSSTSNAGRPFDVECRLRMKDGSYRFFHIRGVPRRDERGWILRWYGITADVDDEKQAELARLDMEERYRLDPEAADGGHSRLALYVAVGV